MSLINNNNYIRLCRSNGFNAKFYIIFNLHLSYTLKKITKYTNTHTKNLKKKNNIRLY